MECKSIYYPPKQTPTRLNGINMVTDCPNGYANSTIRNMCQNINGTKQIEFIAPVYGKGYVYQNIYCAVCHSLYFDDIFHVNISLQNHCDPHTNTDTATIAAYILRHCLPITFIFPFLIYRLPYLNCHRQTCSNDTSALHRNMCSNYQQLFQHIAPPYYDKVIHVIHNYHCVTCNMGQRFSFQQFAEMACWPFRRQTFTAFTSLAMMLNFKEDMNIPKWSTKLMPCQQYYYYDTYSKLCVRTVLPVLHDGNIRNNVSYDNINIAFIMSNSGEGNRTTLLPTILSSSFWFDSKISILNITENSNCAQMVTPLNTVLKLGKNFHQQNSSTICFELQVQIENKVKALLLIGNFISNYILQDVNMHLILNVVIMFSKLNYHNLTCSMTTVPSITDVLLDNSSISEAFSVSTSSNTQAAIQEVTSSQPTNTLETNTLVLTPGTKILSQYACQQNTTTDIICDLITVPNDETLATINHEGKLLVTHIHNNHQIIIPDYILGDNGTFLVCKEYLLLHSIEEPLVEIIVSVTTISASLLCLLHTFIVYCRSPHLRNLPGKCIMCLVASLFLTDVTFLTNKLLVNFPLLCTMLAATQHALWLISFSWMNVLAFNICKQFSAEIKVQYNTKYTFLKYNIYAWGLPSFFVIGCVILDYLNLVELHYGYGEACWIRPGLNLFLFFGLPLLVFLLLNMALFIISIMVIHRSIEQSAEANKMEKYKEIAIFIKIASIMGFGWLFGFLANWYNYKVLWYMFIMLTGLQGIQIWLSFIIKPTLKNICVVCSCIREEK